MGNVCAPDEACFSGNMNKQRRKSQSAQRSTEKKMIGGCLILKVKKVNINSSKLQDVLMSHQVNASQVQMILQFRNQTYDLDTLKSDFEQLCLGDMSDCKRSQVQKVDQDDQFKFNVDNITSQDIVSIKLLVPPNMTSTDDYFHNNQKEGAINDLQK